MRRIAVIVQALALVITSRIAPVSAAGKAMAQAAVGALAGTASTSTGQTLAGVVVNLRDLAGNLVGTTTTNAAGSFTFTALNPGNYIAEVATQAGQIVGSTAATTVVAGATTTVSVTASAAAAIAGGAAGGAAAAAGAAGGAAGAAGGAAAAVAGAAGAAGVAGLTTAQDQQDASASQ